MFILYALRSCFASMYSFCYLINFVVSSNMFFVIFQSLRGIVNASKEEISLCPGFGPQKVTNVFAKTKS